MCINVSMNSTKASGISSVSEPFNFDAAPAPAPTLKITYQLNLYKSRRMCVYLLVYYMEIVPAPKCWV